MGRVFAGGASRCCPFVWGGEAGVQEPSRRGPHPTTARLARQCLLSSISGPAQSHGRGMGVGGGVG